MVQRRKPDEIVGVLEFEGRTEKDVEFVAWLAEWRGAWISGADALSLAALGSGDADIAWASQVQHAVESVDGNGHLCRSALVRMRAQLVADHLFPPVHGGFDPGSPVVSRRGLPRHAPMPGYALEVAVLLGRCVLGRIAQHRGRAWRHDDGRFRMALGNAGVDTVLVVRAVAGE